MTICLSIHKERIFHGATSALLLCALFAFAGCVEPEDEVAAETATTTTVSNPPVGVVDDSAGFYVRTVENENYTYITHRGDESGSTPATYAGSFGWARKCTAALGDDVMCYVEGTEFDLWMFGYKLQYNVPSDMCSYLGVSMPWFYTYPTGEGPGVVKYTENESTGVPIDQINSGSGVPFCPFDHTTEVEDGPNCCSGTYVKTVGVTGGSGVASAPTTESWGGSAANCAAGPAMKLMPKGTDGLPTQKYLYVGGVGINDVHDLSRAVSSSETFSSFSYANYFDIETSRNYGLLTTSNTLGLRVRDLPPAFSPLANPYLNGTSNIAIPGSVPALNALGFVPAGNTTPFFEYTCYDRYLEVKARIRLMVRPWDTASKLGTATSYAHSYGAETGVGDGYPLHDVMTWNDIFFNYTLNDGTSLRKSWANTLTGQTGCTTSTVLGGPYASNALPCRKEDATGTSHYTGFPGINF